jgi:D-sedoheptulose 7-phosphate isomerase
MKIMELEKAIRNYFAKLKETIDRISLEEIEQVLQVLGEARAQGRQIFVMGNGGSAATASHLVCDLNKGTASGKNGRFKVICLNDNIPTLMAYANDLSYDDIFVEQLKNFFQPKDVVIGISGSGNSKNILKALEFANAQQGLTIGLSGYNGGKLKETARYNIHVPVDDMLIVEDLHLVLDHLMTKMLS